MKIRTILCCCLLLIPLNLLAEPTNYDLGAHTPVNAAIRSTVLPGWGQFFNSDTTKGYVVSAGFVVTALASYYFYSKANDTYADYENKGVKGDALYSDYETQSNQAAITSFIAAGIWVYGIADAYITGHSIAEISANGRQKDGIRIAAGGSTVGLVMRKSF
jgi:hypothetical protein